MFNVVTGTRAARVVGAAGAPAILLLLNVTMPEDGERSKESVSDSQPERVSVSDSQPEASATKAAAAEEIASADDLAAQGDAADGAADDGGPKAGAPSDAESAEDDDSPAQGTTSADTERGSSSAAPRRRTSRLWWALPILMVVEFYVYGHNGRLEICVGKEGDTDFSLVGQARTDDNRWKFPRCETRLNLGLRSQKQAKIEEGTKVACRGATIFRHQGESKACVDRAKGWVHRVEGHFVAPWEPAYYQHLFWFLQ